MPGNRAAIRSGARSPIAWLASAGVVFAVQGIAAGGPAALPQYFVAIHCEPHAATMPDWLSLSQIVAYAQARGIRLTLQFTPQWVALIQNQGLMNTVRTWEAMGHEVAGHHHTLDHAASWDGYSNDPAAPGSPRPPGFQGTMQAYIDVINQLAAPGDFIHTVSSKNADFPPAVPFQTGGDLAGIPPGASIPTVVTLNGSQVWNLQHAALIRGGTWFNSDLEGQFLAATGEQAFGVAFHPNDYRPDPGPINAWFDFLVSQDPSAERSRTVRQILCPLPVRGDMNCDGGVNSADVEGFIQALIDPAGYGASHPGCFAIHGDLDCDGQVSASDVPLLAELLAE
jgi:hypothetical protein